MDSLLSQRAEAKGGQPDASPEGERGAVRGVVVTWGRDVKGTRGGSRTNLKCNNYLHGYELRGRDAQAPMMPHRQSIAIFILKYSNVLHSPKEGFVSILRPVCRLLIVMAFEKENKKDV